MKNVATCTRSATTPAEPSAPAAAMRDPPPQGTVSSAALPNKRARAAHAARSLAPWLSRNIGSSRWATPTTTMSTKPMSAMWACWPMVPKRSASPPSCRSNASTTP
ncbi:MAG: hypothetical protein IPF99_06790 [Deltaproteobacteria bacterium]|nr:hypothetical protein [Deltaproteobacteria bacterium]